MQQLVLPRHLSRDTLVLEGPIENTKTTGKGRPMAWIVKPAMIPFGGFTTTEDNG